VRRRRGLGLADWEWEREGGRERKKGGPGWVVDPRKVVVVGFSALPSPAFGHPLPAVCSLFCSSQPLSSPPLYTPRFSSFPLENRRILMLFLKSSSYSFKAQISFWVSVSILGILYMLKNILPSFCWIVARVNVTIFLHLLFDGKDAKEHAISQQEWLTPQYRSS
jgi:hypothetical protein